VASRRLAVAIVLSGAVVGGALIAIAPWLQPQFQVWLEEDARTRVTMVMTAMALATSGPLLGMGVYLWRLDPRTRRGGQVLHWCGAALVVLAVLLSYALVRFATLIRANL
jgi:hypothetical protein